MPRAPKTTLAFILLLAAAGCGRSGPSRVNVTGKVSFADRPVPAGRIYFEPTMAAGTHAPTGFAVICDGQYRTEPGRGPGPGPYRARISGGDGTPVGQTMNMDPEAPPESVRRVGHLLFSNHEVPVEVPEADATIDFDIPADAAAGEIR